MPVGGYGGKPVPLGGKCGKLPVPTGAVPTGAVPTGAVPSGTEYEEDTDADAECVGTAEPVPAGMLNE